MGSAVWSADLLPNGHSSHSHQKTLSISINVMLLRAEEMAQTSRTLDVLAEDPSLVPTWSA